MRKQLLSLFALLLMVAGGAVAQNANSVNAREFTRTPSGTWMLNQMPGWSGQLEITLREAFRLDSIPLTWTVMVAGVDKTSLVTAYTAEEGPDTLGWLNVLEGDTVELVPPTVVKPTVKNVTLTDNSVPAGPEGVHNRQFSVSATKQVLFSQGNLQATTTDLGSTWTWAFAANQWDYIGNATANTSINGNGTVSENGTVDLFGWVGASSTWTGAAQYGISNSKTYNSTDTYGNVADETLKSDWGNTIGSGWRTLTSDEWTYLFNTRTVNGGTGEGKSYTKGQSVNGKSGVVIYPDDYTGAEYTGSDWATFEAAGCVFLPAAGYRSGSTVSNAGTSGRYRSSSPRGTNKAYYVNFDLSDLFPASSTLNRYYGFSVRLVRDIE